MKAAVCRVFGEPLVIEDVTLASPGEGEVRVSVKACAICHSDILYANGAWGGRLPAIYGHEAAGVIEEIGPGVRGLAVGDHVVVTLVRSCGTCPCCEQGFYGSCEAKFPRDSNDPINASDGSRIKQGLRTSAFAEQTIVDASQAVVIDKDVPFASASLLACGVITGLGAVVNTAKVRAGSSVAVIGVGGVGLNAVQGAALTGARSVIAIDIADDKLEAAKSFGATQGVNSKNTDATLAVLEATGGRGADYVFVTVGAKQAFDQSHKMIARGGAVVIVGMAPVGVMSEFDPLTLADDSKRIIGSKMGSSNIQRDIPNLVSLYKQKRLKLDELITGRYRLEQINEAIAEAERGDALRNVIEFD